MQYVGIQTQQRRNNWRSLLLLLLFPTLVVVLLYGGCYLLALYFHSGDNEGMASEVLATTHQLFVPALPYTIGIVLVWFLIAYWSNTRIINAATGAEPLARKDNPRVYNLVENLCMAQGMKMPQINIINDSSLNAYASGINERTYTVTLSRGIINKLNDEELEAVIAHELTHIRNHDVRLLIVSIVFVGIFALLAQVTLQAIPRMRMSSNNKNNGAGLLVIMLVMLLMSAIGYFFTLMMRFAISRKREYMADAGSAEMTRNPLALAGALKKISGDPYIEAVQRDDVAQLFIQHPRMKAHGGLGSLFATHPPIEKRIQILEQF
ncbi:MAG: M48 family metallopeptidase [Prevotellaceae bacterium]|jgi:heat shock protein HtpX|nr:M48 family metallopeptidase [Prevotellaceae bacterium]